MPPSDRTPEPLSREERERILARCEAAKNPDDKLCGERPFPIQQSEPVPWSYAERAYRTYSARFGIQQSLERLAERGGFGLEEFSCLYVGHVPGECRPPHHPPRNEASLHCVRFASEALAQHVIARLARMDLPRALATIAALEQQLADASETSRYRRSCIDTLEPAALRCAICAAPAACVGSYEGAQIAPACNECCGHANEDGWCVPVAEVIDKVRDIFRVLEEDAEAAERALSEATAEVGRLRNTVGDLVNTVGCVAQAICNEEPLHLDGCPEDDTCECMLPAMINAALATPRAPPATETEDSDV